MVRVAPGERSCEGPHDPGFHQGRDRRLFADIDALSADGPYGDAKARLEALHQPVPTPPRRRSRRTRRKKTAGAKASTVAKVMGNFQKHPDVAQAARVGDPTLVDPKW